MANNHRALANYIVAGNLHEKTLDQIAKVIASDNAPAARALKYDMQTLSKARHDARRQVLPLAPLRAKIGAIVSVQKKIGNEHRTAIPTREVTLETPAEREYAAGVGVFPKAEPVKPMPVQTPAAKKLVAEAAQAVEEIDADVLEEHAALLEDVARWKAIATEEKRAHEESNARWHAKTEQMEARLEEARQSTVDAVARYEPFQSEMKEWKQNYYSLKHEFEKQGERLKALDAAVTAEGAPMNVAAAVQRCWDALEPFLGMSNLILTATKDGIDYEEERLVVTKTKGRVGPKGG